MSCGCGEPDNVKCWSLTLFRHGPQGLVDDLEKAHFRYGRVSSEMDYMTRVATLPKAVINAINEAGLESRALESGLKVEISISQRIKEANAWKKVDKSEGWTRMEMVAEGAASFMGSMRMRWSFCVSGTNDTLEIVQANRYSGKEMPNEVWIRVSELPPGELIWAMDNEILSDGSDGSENENSQDTLDKWVSIEPGIKVEEAGDITEVRLPGKPFCEYKFIK
jgi:hypothetical protein